MVANVTPAPDDRPRCFWAGGDPMMIAYHDTEWGVPCHDDRQLFEMLTLEGAQAGLAWITILRKREGYRRAFHDFDVERIARYDDSDVIRLMGDEGIVRNRLKILATIKNAAAFLEVQRTEGSFDRYVWAFVGGRTLRTPGLTHSTIPAHTPESDALSKGLKKRGFSFVGTTIIYAFMQSVGMVDDHLPECFRYAGRTSPPALEDPLPAPPRRGEGC